ncbi:hypothetical protein LEP1GSC191_1702 [Leptospira borgpetersenii serovar Mini str. 201000851]|nr:hypothetical protein LEP1GSC191_1702 [Leptospira borgpetersenii serovar Mini str. 201000851]
MYFVKNHPKKAPSGKVIQPQTNKLIKVPSETTKNPIKGFMGGSSPFRLLKFKIQYSIFPYMITK